MSKEKKALIIGAGPAGLTAAYELITRTNYLPIILETDSQVGGLAKSIETPIGRSDIGPHRFFSKSDRVMNWWLEKLPLEKTPEHLHRIKYRGKSRFVEEKQNAPSRDESENLMLLVNRQTRILYQGKLYDYPIKLNLNTISNLGWINMIKIGLSYIHAKISPIKPEDNLEAFFVNRFGYKLYRTFFEDYTQKVWGLHPTQISADWGAQRVKGLSLTKVLTEAFLKILPGKSSIETSLVEQFIYPKNGAGQMWEFVAKQITSKGGKILTNCEAKTITTQNSEVTSVTYTDKKTQKIHTVQTDLVFSTMPIPDLVSSFKGIRVPKKIRQIANGLEFRDMVHVTVLTKNLRLTNNEKLLDNWLYIQDPRAKVGRIQICNNMSPYLVPQKNKILLGLEYYCNHTDQMWKWSENRWKKFITKDLETLGLVNKKDLVSVEIMKIKKTYPAYFGTYDQLQTLINWVSQIDNLFLIGRNGMHKYNNQDHSMLTAMVAVDNLLAKRKDKSNIWQVNTEHDYHEKAPLK